MKLVSLLMAALLLSSCAFEMNTIDSDAEAIDVYCEGFNYPSNDSTELKQAGLAYLKNSSNEFAQGFVLVANGASNSDSEMFLLLIEICGERPRWP